MFGSDDGERHGRVPARDRAGVVADLRRTLGRAGAAWSAEHGGAGAAAPFPAAQGDAPGAGAAPPVPGLLAVPSPLAAVLPRGGVPLGSVVSLASAAPGRSGTTSLLLSLLAAPHDTWTAVVGMPGLGVLAAAEIGVDLDRLALIPDPGPDVLQVLSVLSDGVDVIATVPPATLPPARQRVLTGRLRQRGTVLLVVGRWPGADLTMTVRDVRWSGIGQGHGRLRDREIDVQVGGRRAGAAGGGAAGSLATLVLRASRDSVTVQPAHEAIPNASPTETALVAAPAAASG